MTLLEAIRKVAYAPNAMTGYKLSVIKNLLEADEGNIEKIVNDFLQDVGVAPAPPATPSAENTNLQFTDESIGDWELRE